MAKEKQDIVYNLKYLPVPDLQSPVNVSRIRKILEERSLKAESVRSHQSRDEKDLIENVGYFNANHFRQKNDKKSETNSSFGKYKLQTLNFRSGPEEYTKQKPSAVKFFNGNFPHSTKQQNTSNQFISTKLEMQSVIEPGAKFVRSPRDNRTNIANYSKNQAREVKQTEQKYFLKAVRKSGESMHSGNSYFSSPGYRVNASSLY